MIDTVSLLVSSGCPNSPFPFFLIPSFALDHLVCEAVGISFSNAIIHFNLDFPLIYQRCRLARAVEATCQLLEKRSDSSIIESPEIRLFVSGFSSKLHAANHLPEKQDHQGFSFFYPSALSLSLSNLILMLVFDLKSYLIIFSISNNSFLLLMLCSVTFFVSVIVTICSID